MAIHWARSGLFGSGVGEPDPTETRLLAAAADQVGQAARARPARQRSPRPPRSPARATRSSPPSSNRSRTTFGRRSRRSALRPGRCVRDVGSNADDHQESVDAIDREVEYLNRLVTNLLDLSRIEAGVLRAERDVFELDDLAGRTVERLRPAWIGPCRRRTPAPPVEVDPVFLDEAADERDRERHQVHTDPDTSVIRAGHEPGEPSSA